MEPDARRKESARGTGKRDQPSVPRPEVWHHMNVHPPVVFLVGLLLAFAVLAAELIPLVAGVAHLTPP